jgi:hypothetical protein
VCTGHLRNCDPRSRADLKRELDKEVSLFADLIRYFRSASRALRHYYENPYITYV